MIGAVITFTTQDMAIKWLSGDNPLHEIILVRALVAPFEYAALPLAVFWSVVLWGDWPDPMSWLGIALIAGAGLYVFYRETVRGRQIVLRRPIFCNR